MGSWTTKVVWLDFWRDRVYSSGKKGAKDGKGKGSFPEGISERQEQGKIEVKTRWQVKWKRQTER